MTCGKSRGGPKDRLFNRASQPDSEESRAAETQKSLAVNCHSRGSRTASFDVLFYCLENRFGSRLLLPFADAWPGLFRRDRVHPGLCADGGRDRGIPAASPRRRGGWPPWEDLWDQPEGRESRPAERAQEEDLQKPPAYTLGLSFTGYARGCGLSCHLQTCFSVVLLGFTLAGPQVRNGVEAQPRARGSSAHVYGQRRSRLLS